MPSDNTGQALGSSRRELLAGAGTLAGAGLAGCLSAFNGDGGGSSEEITVLTSESDPNTKEIWNQLSEDFKEETGHTVKWEYVGFGERLNRLSAMIRGGNAPEVLIGNTANAGVAFSEGHLEPLTDTIAAIEEESGTTIPRSMVFEDGGEQWFAPGAVYMQTRTVRGDLVQEVGEDFKRQGVSTDDHIRWARKIDEQTDVRGFGHPAAATGAATQSTTAILWANGVDIYGGPTDDIEVVVDQGQNRERAIKTLEYLRELYNYGPDGANWGWGELGDSFTSSTTASVSYPLGRMIAGATSADQPWAPENVNLLDEPYLDGLGEDERKILGAVFGWAAINKADNPDIGKDFIEFFFSTDYYIDFLLTVPMHFTPVVDSVFDNERFRSNEIVSQKEEALAIQRDMVNNRVAVPALSGEGGAFNPVGPTAYAEGTIGKGVAQVALQGKDPGAAVDTMAEDLRALKE